MSINEDTMEVLFEDDLAWGEETVYVNDTLPPLQTQTFGVEIECYLVTNAGSMTNIQNRGPKEHEYFIRKTIVQAALEKAGIRALCREDIQTDAIRLDPEEFPLKDHFIIQSDASIGPSHEDIGPCFEGSVTPIEIISPPFKLNADSLACIEKVAEVLDSIGCAVNASCGLHCHTGNFSRNKTVGFSFKAVKNVAHLIVVAHKQLAQLHSSERLLSEFTMSPHTLFYTDDVFHMAAQIEACRRLEPEFLNLLHYPETDWVIDKYPPAFLMSRSMSTNFLNLEGKYRTIEWRAHSATLDGKAISRWVRTVSFFIRVAADPGTYNPFEEVTQRIRNSRGSTKTYSILDLLTDLGAEDLAKEWEFDIHDHSLIPDSWFPRLRN